MRMGTEVIEMNKKKKVKVISYFLLVILAVMMLFPFFWMVRSSFMTNREITTVPIQWIPSQFNLDNFVEAFTKDSFGRYFLNSIIIVGINMVGAVFSASSVSYTHLDVYKRQIQFYEDMKEAQYKELEEYGEIINY